MANTRKRLNKAACRLLPGLAANISGMSWGSATGLTALGSGHGFPYLARGIKGNNAVEEDNSVSGVAFADLPNQVGLNAQMDGWNGEMKYLGMDRWLYWAFGYEDPRSTAPSDGSPQTVFKFTVAGVSVTPLPGAIYTNNSSTFLVFKTSIASGAGWVKCHRTAGTNNPSGNTLVKTGGTGDNPLTFSAEDHAYYSHVFELDKYDRHVAAYRTHDADIVTPDPVGYAAGDRKNRNLILAYDFGPNDYRYPWLMCSGFGFGSSAQSHCGWNAKGQAWCEQRADYSVAGATYPTGMEGSAYNVLHHQFNISIGPPGSLVDLSVKSFELGIEIPLSSDQSSESGLYMEEPVMEGRYALTFQATLNRHSVDTYLAYRDAFTACAAKLEAVYGDFLFGLYLQDLRIIDAPITEDDVANHPLTFAASLEPTSNSFTGEMGHHTLRQGGPLVAMTINQNSTNEMRRE